MTALRKPARGGRSPWRSMGLSGVGPALWAIVLGCGLAAPAGAAQTPPAMVGAAGAAAQMSAAPIVLRGGDRSVPTEPDQRAADVPSAPIVLRGSLPPPPAPLPPPPPACPAGYAYASGYGCVPLVEPGYDYGYFDYPGYVVGWPFFVHRRHFRHFRRFAPPHFAHRAFHPEFHEAPGRSFAVGQPHGISGR